MISIHNGQDTLVSSLNEKQKLKTTKLQNQILTDTRESGFLIATMARIDNSTAEKQNLK